MLKKVFKLKKCSLIQTMELVVAEISQKFKWLILV